MARLHGPIQWDGTFQEITTVHSRAYGNHIRKARKKFTLGEQMKESSARMQQANVYAKIFKDAIDPYRRDFRDGQLWQRLVSVFKKQIKLEGKADFSVIEGDELNKIHALSWILNSTTTAAQDGKTLNVQVTSCQSKKDPTGKADGYQQTIIVMFVDDAMQIKSFSESIILPFNAHPEKPAGTPGTTSITAHWAEQKASWSIPEKATTAIVVLKCNFSAGQKPLSLQKGMGMRVEKVVAIG
jgi:hypothetical protein